MSNPNPVAIALTNPLTDSLPAGVVIADSGGDSTCGLGTGGGVVPLEPPIPGGGSVTLKAGSTIPASGSCTSGVNVTAPAAGAFVNTIPAGALKTTAGNNADPASAILTVTGACLAITLAPPTVPAGSVGVTYSQQITASGGTGSYTFSVVSGTLPAGLTLTSGGLLSGTPTTVASSTVTIRATDGSGCSGVITYTIVIAAPGCPAIALAPPTVPAGSVGVTYSQQITASGGTGSYNFTVLSGTLPAGLTLSSGGLLSGTPTTLGSSTVAIQATDGSGCPGVITYTINIVIVVPSLPQAFVVLLALGLTGVGYYELRRRA